MKDHTNRPLRILAGCALSALSLLAAGCSSAGVQPSEKAAGENGAQLWGDNCARCHNYRSPSMYSEAQWEIITLHMRLRGNLTADEHKEILAFLKSAH